MATEVTFAKTFLALLDSKFTKISPDHVEDPRNYPGSSPYTLPRHPSQKPFSKPTTKPTATTTTTTTTTTTPTSTTTPSAANDDSIRVTVTSPRNPAFTLTLPRSPLPLTTSLAEVKEQVAAETGIPLAKIKVLFNKKPVGDSKSLKDLVSSAPSVGEKGLELGVMVLGGAVLVPKAAAAAAAGAGAGAGDAAGGGGVKEEEGQTQEAAPVAQGLSGQGVLGTGEFWEDLRGFLQQRVRDEGVAGEALGVFKAAWEGRA